MSEAKLSHVDAGGRPQMVDVGDKQVTRRDAVAVSRVVFTAEVAERLRGEQMRVGKGPVIDTAIIAGTQAVKRTADLIPFCHPLPILGCRIEIDWCDAVTLQISCQVRTEHRTGVEMEALTGASVAALTIYDMCKALSHEIVISDTRLQAKRGGRQDVGEGRLMAEVEVLYFAALAERRGTDRERLRTAANSPAELYAELDARHGLGFPRSSLRVAQDGAFVDWDSPLCEGAEVVFVPPVSGG